MLQVIGQKSLSCHPCVKVQTDRLPAQASGPSRPGISLTALIENDIAAARRLPAKSLLLYAHAAGCAGQPSKQGDTASQLKMPAAPMSILPAAHHIQAASVTASAAHFWSNCSGSCLRRHEHGAPSILSSIVVEMQALTYKGITLSISRICVTEMAAMGKQALHESQAQQPPLVQSG